ncbi:MAG: Eco57I restriction-modification methylase domain-containing protein, partial [Leptospiraceae bacterium]|nr:Eco57I restriction-modification methylase domain-containing protein [Leptospiraceae bacterium]
DIFEDEFKFSDREYKKLNPFDWQHEFFKPLGNRKFDVIIGNPPYVTYSLGRGRKKSESVSLKYLLKTWKNSSDYKLNSFALFFELATVIWNKDAFASFI